jgi:hypothetical protein
VYPVTWNHLSGILLSSFLQEYQHYSLSYHHRTLYACHATCAQYQYYSLSSYYSETLIFIQDLYQSFKLGVYIMPPESISMAHFIISFHQ